jgi:hypothetical protein
MKTENFTLFRRLLLIVPMGAALGGCMTSSPIWEAHFGETVRHNAQAQVIDPNAAARTASQPGIDGKSAAAAMDNYDKSFVNPAPTQAYNSTSSSSGSSGGGSTGSQ